MVILDFLKCGEDTHFKAKNHNEKRKKSRIIMIIIKNTNNSFIIILDYKSYKQLNCRVSCEEWMKKGYLKKYPPGRRRRKEEEEREYLEICGCKM